MRKTLIFCLIGLFLGVGAVALIEFDPGYVLLSFADYTLETSIWVAALLLLVLYTIFYICYRVWKRFWGSRRSFSGWRKSRNAEQGGWCGDDSTSSEWPPLESHTSSAHRLPITFLSSGVGGMSPALQAFFHPVGHELRIRIGLWRRKLDSPGVRHPSCSASSTGCPGEGVAAAGRGS